MDLVATITDSSAHAATDFKDPFAKESVSQIWITLDKRYGISGHIEMKNGKTEGKQNFSAASYPELIAQMSAFIQALP